MAAKKQQSSKDRELAERMLTLFASYSKSSGTHGMPEREPSGLKWSIKKTAKTVKNMKITADTWIDHIEGRRPLGLVPILDDSTCLWGCVDVDKYNIDHLEVITRVEAMKLPLVPCRSKSNGLHLFLFMSEPVQAAIVQLALRNMAAMMGFSDSEIFPKQTQISHSDDSGSWMVMPYFGGTFGDKLQLQHGLKKTGAEMTLEEFLVYAEKRRVTEEMIIELRKRTMNVEPAKTNGSKPPRVPFSDGPPCLQFLAESGFPEGGRNNALLHIGVYLKKAHPAAWKDKLEEDNQKYMKPPLPSSEVKTVIEGLEKKDYEYLCKHQPMSSHCDSMTCRTRKHGVGDDTYPEIVAVRKYWADPIMWYVDIMGLEGAVTLELSTDDFQVYQRFQKMCMDSDATMLFKALNQNQWTAIVQNALLRVEHLRPPPDVGAGGMFAEMLEKFLTNRTRGAKREDLLGGRPWEDEEEKRHYFRLQDLQKFLDRENVKGMTRPKITSAIAAMHGVKDRLFKPSARMNIKGHHTNVWWVPSSVLQITPEIDPPDVPREKI